jgi:thioredoxin 1
LIQNAVFARTAQERNMAEIELTDKTFETELAATKELFVVDLWAEWCQPCKMIAPMLSELADEHKDKMRIAKVNIDTYPAVAQKYEVKGIPTILVFRNGELKEKITGALPKKMLEKKLLVHFI